MKVVMLVWVIATYLLLPNVPQNMLILCAKTNQNHAVLGSERNGASQLDSPGNWCQEKKELTPVFPVLLSQLYYFCSQLPECTSEVCYFHTIFFSLDSRNVDYINPLISVSFLCIFVQKIESNFIWVAVWILGSWCIWI